MANWTKARTLKFCLQFSVSAKYVVDLVDTAHKLH